MPEGIGSTRDVVILERRPGAVGDAGDFGDPAASNDATNDANNNASGGTTARPSFVPATPQALAIDGSIASLDLPHRNPEARDRFGRRMPIAIDGLAWLPQGASLPASVAERFRERFRLKLRTHLAWRPAAGEAAAPLDVVKQVSFLHASAGTAATTFRDHYRRHVEIARRHMPALWQYVQNDVEFIAGGIDGGIDGNVAGDAPEALGVMAVSELWFRTTDDFLNRYFPSEQDQRDFSAQEGFLDLTQATSFICTNHIVERGVPQARGGGQTGNDR